MIDEIVIWKDILDGIAYLFLLHGMTAKVRHFVDDEPPHVVLDRLGHRFPIAANAVRQRVERAGSALKNQFHERQIVKGRNLFAFAGPYMGVEQVPHRRFVNLEIDVVAACEFHFGADFLIVVNFIADCTRLGRGVAGSLHFIGEVGISTQICCRHLVQGEAFR